MFLEKIYKQFTKYETRKRLSQDVLWAGKII